MATVDEVKTEIINRMQALYRAPYGIERPEDALAEYVGVLVRYPQSTLHAAWKKLVPEYDRRDWPTITDIIQYCNAHERDAKQLDRARMNEEKKPDPWKAFTGQVLVFVKRDEQTFVDFRDAGVRAIVDEYVLEFDDEASTALIRDRYGAELDAFMGRHVPLQVNAATPNSRWVEPKWEKDKPYRRSA